MTGEEIVQALLDRIAAKRDKIGDLTLTLSSLERLLRESLVAPERKPEPGYPKKMTKPVANETPWVPKGPEPPMVAWVSNRREEGEAFAKGFRE
jgi:hypothetical protein